MKQKVIFVLLDDFADWEGAFLSSALNTGILPVSDGETDYLPKTMSPIKGQVRSLGGMSVTVDYTLATMPEDFAALILIGGKSWHSEDAEALVPLVEKTLTEGRLVGAICNATLFLGAHGLLDHRRHTSNTLEFLTQWAREHYTGKALYEERQAVRDGNLITANGTACLEFTRECLDWLQVGTPEQVEGYYHFNKHGLYNQ